LADPLFPSSLPGPLWDEQAWSPLFDNRIRTSFPTAQKVRPRARFVPERYRCVLLLTEAQLEELLDFHDITCNWTGAFRWWDFRRPNDTDRHAQYAFRERPEHARDGDLMRVTLDLDLLQTFPGSYPIADDTGAALTTDDDEILST